MAIEIWAPRYSTDDVLIATHKVQPGENLIVFTKAKHLKGKIFMIPGEEIVKYPKQPNGRGFVYCVPFAKLKEITPEEFKI